MGTVSAVANFTPGPWRIEDFLIKAGGDESGERGGIKIAKFGISEILAAEDDANASLIAAAPDLYAALAGLVDVIAEINGFADDAGNPAWAAAIAALAKARGES